MFNEKEEFNEMVKNYKRLEIDDINDDGVVTLLETLHKAINSEMESLATNSARFPKDEEIKNRIINLERYLQSDLYNAISLGRGDDVLKKFRKMVAVAKTKKYETVSVEHTEKKKTYTVQYKCITDPKDVREKMISWRESNDISLPKMSSKTGISQQLLRMVEGGHVTHPLIAKKIQKAYGLTDEETKYLVPKIHWEEPGLYDPERYKLPDDYVKKIPMPKEKTIIETYMKERRETAARNHDWRGIY